MPLSSLNCPSCGAMLELKYRHSKMVVCKYCGQTSYLNVGSIFTVGSPIVLADYGSILSVGKSGKIRNKPFEVVGRLRFDYEDGFWDEWLLIMENEDEIWLQEDEGEFVLFRKKNLSDPPQYTSLVIGSITTIDTDNVFLTEKNKAVINGGEGELPFQVVAGEKADYVDGIVVGKKLIASFEYMPEGVVYNVGEPLSMKDFLFT
ncbi:DUF4178 domain-containing protein [Cytophagaceae bacterium DM2B3-1]|uniref:DUF4178 domain-containing protein n=1 Tax=Xanthocytophaga flava TaxID=3048013 RepID=A0ABT7CPI2_9BACT|nr:DUF4178 domain-containing protein [Xanthocytophaga flavus]MDJ1495643.1 DUF4178 domain-containing protein [Xanthocytophaga flavus]